MKATLLLNDEPETARLMLEEVTSGGVAVRESEARAGCNCDRWGHPLCGGVSTRKKTKRKPTLRFPRQSNSELSKSSI